MQNDDEWYKENEKDRTWWKETPGIIGLFIFSFDRINEFNLFQDYPEKLTDEERRIFDEENPFWRDFFSERQK